MLVNEEVLTHISQFLQKTTTFNIVVYENPCKKLCFLSHLSESINGPHLLLQESYPTNNSLAQCQ